MRRLALLAPLFLAVACADGDGTDSDTATSDTGAGDPIARGEAIYDANCVACHGADGEGGSARAIADLGAEYPTDAELEEWIRDGDNSMVDYPESSISADEMADLIAFLRANFD